MTVTPQRQLPMLGQTHGNRSAVTCHLRCGDACAFPVPNASENPTFRDVAAKALSRRGVLGAAGALTLSVAATTALAGPAAAKPGKGRGKGGGKGQHPFGGLPFEAIDPVSAEVDDLTVPEGYEWHSVIRWGDPILAGAPMFDANNQTPQAQAGQFGYNCDYLDILVDRSGRGALLVANHEYTNEGIMFPPGTDPETLARTVWEAHGLSVVELTRKKEGAPWRYVKGARRNRRITINTEFSVDGPAAGSDLLKTAADPSGTLVRGTMNNCAGGTTPWGSILSGEENFNQYFLAAGLSAEEKRYGLGAQDGRGWRQFDARWDATNPDYVNEPNRFGWVVEIDPEDPTSTPVKHTAMGRFKHEGANVIVSNSGHVVAYMGDDERFDYVYKFVSRDTYDGSGTPAARRHNLTVLSEGDLYVARFTGDGLEDGISDGTGEWIPLTQNGESMVEGMTIEQVLVYTRLAADKVQPTKMDRPEDVEPNLHNGKIYVACTNNTSRGNAGQEGPTESNPRAANKDGHVVEITEDAGDHTGTTFTWNLLLICGDPATAGTYFGGYTGEVSPISCPDNVAFDSAGNLWVSTDGQPSALQLADGLFKVPLAGAERGRVQQFLAVPREAETCGPVIHDRDDSVFVAVQHPGENGSWADIRSYFPDYAQDGAGFGEFAGPRPSVAQVTRKPGRGRGRGPGRY